MRIKIHTRNIGKKLLAISCKLTAFRKLLANSYKLKASRGFTLVELLVTLSLFVILSGIVLFSQQKFNGSILLTNLAYDVALTVRQAQTFGINVREDIKSGSFQLPYGVHFDISKDKQFLIFADVNGTGKYENPSSDSLINSYSIKKGNRISDIRIINSDTGCSYNDGGCSVNKLDITFLRPDPDAIFRSTDPNKNDITEAKIIISSPTGDSRNVSVNSTGQISINRGSGTTCSTFDSGDNENDSDTFNFTGSQQCWQVPNGVTNVSINACGAQGVNGGTVLGGGGTGGAGGRAQQSFTVSGGNVFYVNVGGSNGYNGGGTSLGNGGSGGGSSDVRVGSNIIILGAGGGGGGGASGQQGGGNGGSGGGYDGGDGSGGGVSEYGGTSQGGQRGFQDSGGLGNLSGFFGLGGNANSDRSGGGGGGHYGGAAGYRTGNSAGGGGGGGSSYAPLGTTQSGVCSGNGQVIFSSY